MIKNREIYNKTEEMYDKMAKRAKRVIFYDSFLVSPQQFIKLSEIVLGKEDKDVLAYKKAMENEKDTRHCQHRNGHKLKNWNLYQCDNCGKWIRC